MKTYIKFLPDIGERVHELRCWSRKRDVRDRITGWGITTLFVALLYVIAAFSDVSTGEYATRILTFSSVVNPAPPSTASAAVERAPDPGNPGEAAPPLPVREEIALERVVDLEGAGREPAIRRREISDVAQRRTLTRPDLTLDRSQPEPRNRTAPAGLQRRRLPIPGRPALPQVRAPLERQESEIAIPVPEAAAPEERIIIDTPDIRVYDEETLTVQDARTGRIVDWIKSTPKALPDVVRRHMDYLEGDHMSFTTWTHQGREVEIYLLVRQGYDQLHVVVIDGEDSYLFFDRGLSKQASRFRVGSVSRTSGTISRIVSKEREITSDEAQNFYQIFIGWWEETESR